jgi:hypothetical protein
VIPRKTIYLSADLVRYGELTPGIWCPECLLPSAEMQRFAVVTGMHVLGYSEVTVCLDCQTFSVVRIPE